MNMNKMLQQAQKMQKEMEKEQKLLEQRIFEETKNGIKISMTGKKIVESIEIDENTFSEADLEMIQDMIVIVFNSLSEAIDIENEKRMAKFSSGLGGSLPF